MRRKSPEEIEEVLRGLELEYEEYEARRREIDRLEQIIERLKAEIARKKTSDEEEDWCRP